MKTFIVIAILFQAVILNAQTQEWASRYNGPPGSSYDFGYSNAVDGSGNLYVTGVSTGSGTGSDYSTVKYNSAGVQQWVRRYNGTGNSEDIAYRIKVDASGNVYVTGVSMGSTSNQDYVTIKYNSLGDSLWVRRYKGTGNGVDGAYSLAVDGSGNVYVTGYSTGTNVDYITIKYNSSGDSLWVRRADWGSHDVATSVTVDGSGNVYVTGLSYRFSGYAYITIKYNSTGVEKWVREYDAVGYDVAHVVAVDGSGNVYVTGYTKSADLTSDDYLTIKYDSTGADKWQRRYNGPGNGNDTAISLVIDVSGNIYVTGVSTGIGTGTDYTTIKYNSSGDSLWVRRYNGPGNGLDASRSAALDASGNLYVTGASAGSGTGNDYATIKYNSSGVQQWLIRYNGAANDSDYPYSIALDGSGNVYVSGGSIGSGTGVDYATIKYSQSGTLLNLTLTAFIEGFYNQTANTMISDTARVYLRNATAPYAIVDSSKAKLDVNGTAIFSFTHSVNGSPYYIVVKHRNSIETWSSSGNSFVANALTYNFSTAANKAYGNNMKSVDASPVRFGIYSGDVIRDGFVNLTDIIKVLNDGTNFISGYAVSDVNGDNAVNLTDLLITSNNSSGFVSLVRP